MVSKFLLILGVFGACMVSIGCGDDPVTSELNQGGDLGGGDLIIKDEPVMAKSQYITIIDDNSIRLSNYGSANSFDFLLSNLLEDQSKGVVVKTSYIGGYSAVDFKSNISEITPTNKGGFKIVLKSNNFKFIMSADIPWLVDGKNNAYKSFDSGELLLQRIDVLNAPDEETAIRRLNRLTGNEVMKNATIIEVVKGGTGKDIIANGVKYLMKR